MDFKSFSKVKYSFYKCLVLLSDQIRKNTPVTGVTVQ